MVEPEEKSIEEDRFIVTNQYSSGSRIVVLERSASVITQIFVPSLSR